MTTTDPVAIPLPPDFDPEAVRAYTYAQAGALLGVSGSTVRRMARAGQLRVAYIWGRPRILPAELRRYLDRLDTPQSIKRRWRTG
jgi:excisionase family DNA binding protein